MNARTLAAITIVSGLALAISGASEADPRYQAPIKIGVANSMFRDLSDAKIETLITEFESLLFDQTGLKCETVRAGDAADVGKRLTDKTLHLGVFLGFEFAWARQTDPDLKPLLIALNKHRNLKAFVVVLNESKAATLADLKGKVLSIPNRSPEHCHLFLQRELDAMGADQKDIFTKVVQHPNSEDALDDILRDKVQAVLVDGVSLENYSQVNPGRHARLKMLKKAEGFPPAVLAYREGGLDDGSLSKLKKGMIGANTTARGKEQLALWKLSGFEDVPADYGAMLADILKRYPAVKGK